MNVTLLARGWRPDLSALVESARDDLLVAAPFIKRPEAEWVTGHLDAHVSLTVLTNVNATSAQDESLDLSALSLFAERPNSTVTTLSRLHAKVFVADERAAIVTSGNLTAGGLDRNYEYGARLDDPSVVRTVRNDLLAYRRVGNTLDSGLIDQLDQVGQALRAERQRAERTVSHDARRAFNRVLRGAEQTFLAAQVGMRSANAWFSEAILVALSGGPLTTADLGKIVPELLPPELCDDTRELVINGERFGKAWKHTLRNAQQQLKRRGTVEYSPTTRTWRLASGA